MAELDVVDFPADVLTALERTAERPRLRPVGFDDPEVAAAFHALTPWVSLPSVTRLSSGRWPRPDQARQAALESCNQRLLHAYDDFIVTAHEHGLDSDPVP